MRAESGYRVRLRLRIWRRMALKAMPVVSKGDGGGRTLIHKARNQHRSDEVGVAAQVSGNGLLGGSG